MIERLRKAQRHTWALLLAALVPATGIIVNAIWPPPSHGYFAEMFLLFLLAVGALFLSRSTATGALFLYCSLALLAVGGMLEYWAGIGGGFSALALVPCAGILIMASTTLDYLATLCYGVVAALASMIYGGILGDLGQAGALAFLAALVTFWALRWVESTDVHVRAEFEKLERDTGELGAMISAINEQWETLNHDP